MLIVVGGTCNFYSGMTSNRIDRGNDHKITSQHTSHKLRGDFEC